MPARTLPNLGLQAFFDFGEDGWDDEMSLNLLKLSVLAQAGAISKVSATPGAPADGDVYIFDETHPTEANKVAIRDAGAWVYVVPSEGWLIYNRAMNYFEKFGGATWAEFATGGGGGSGLPPGGDTDQVLTKLSAADGDADWADPPSGGGGGSDVLAYAVQNVATAMASNVSAPIVITGMTVTFTIAEETTIDITWNVMFYRVSGSSRVLLYVNGAAPMYSAPIGINQGEGGIYQANHGFIMTLAAGTHTVDLRYADALTVQPVEFQSRRLIVRKLA